MRVITVETKKDLESEVDEYILRGYSVKTLAGTGAVVEKKNYGNLGWHIVFLIFTAWWTAFIVNIIYLLISLSKSDEVFIKIESDE